MKVWTTLFIFFVVIVYTKQETPNPQVKELPNENMQKQGEITIKESEGEMNDGNETNNLLNESTS